MFSHVTRGTDDLGRATAFYDRLLAPLGIHRVETNLDRGWAGYARPSEGGSIPFWLLRPLDGRPATVGNGTTVAFEAANRRIVEAVHAAALAAGDMDEGGPGLRPHYHAQFYAAYVRDPDGHKICCVCHHPPA